MGGREARDDIGYLRMPKTQGASQLEELYISRVCSKILLSLFTNLKPDLKHLNQPSLNLIALSRWLKQDHTYI